MSPCDTHEATEETNDASRLQSRDRVSMPEQDERARWAAGVACASQSNTTLYNIALPVAKINQLAASQGAVCGLQLITVKSAVEVSCGGSHPSSH